jgi:hypothetical protein
MLDLSRGLRMDDRKLPISLTALCGQTDADAAPLDSVREGSSVIYFCSAEEISEGFTIALRAMGFETEILLPDIIPQSDTPSSPEDN